MSTVIIIALMFTGILLGYKFFADANKNRMLKHIAGIQKVFTVILLCSMGIWLGGNKDFWDNIAEIGIYGLLFAIAGVMGSILILWISAKLLFKPKTEDKK